MPTIPMCYSSVNVLEKILSKASPAKEFQPILWPNYLQVRMKYDAEMFGFQVHKGMSY